jgi:hypothetical protein
MEWDRIVHLFTAALLTLASVVLLGPSAPSILVQHAAKQALVRLRRNR